MQVGNQTIHVDPTLQFLILIILLERAEDTLKYLRFELTHIPASLFKGNFMQHAAKSLLVDALIQGNEFQKERKKETKKSVESDGTAEKRKKNDETAGRDEQNECEEKESTFQNKEEERNTGMVIVDQDDEVVSQNLKMIVGGGYLFHRVFWKGQTYENIIKCHLSYVKSKYGTATIVLDGYDQMPAKDHEHARQITEQPQDADVFITEKGAINHMHQKFLANGKNEEKLIKLLSVALTQDGPQVIVCEEIKRYPDSW